MANPPKTARGKERRKFPRTHYRAKATLRTPSSEWPAETIDLSFRGALVAIVYRHNVRHGEEIQLSIEVDNHPALFMHGQVAHHRGHMLGLECKANGIEQQKMLRKLVQRSPSLDYANRTTI